MRAHSLLLLVGEARVTTSETNHSHPLDVHADLGGSASDITPELQDLIRQWADHSIRRSEIIKLVSMHLRERVLSSVVKAKVMNVVHHHIACHTRVHVHAHAHHSPLHHPHAHPHHCRWTTSSASTRAPLWMRTIRKTS